MRGLAWPTNQIKNVIASVESKQNPKTGTFLIFVQKKVLLVANVGASHTQRLFWSFSGESQHSRLALLRPACLVFFRGRRVAVGFGSLAGTTTTEPPCPTFFFSLEAKKRALVAVPWWVWRSVSALADGLWPRFSGLRLLSHGNSERQTVPWPVRASAANRRSPFLFYLFSFAAFWPLASVCFLESGRVVQGSPARWISCRHGW